MSLDNFVCDCGEDTEAVLITIDGECICQNCVQKLIDKLKKRICPNCFFDEKEKYCSLTGNKV